MSKSYSYQPAGDIEKTTTGNIDDLDFAKCSLIRMNNASNATIRGLKAGFEGQLAAIISVGAGHVFLAHQNAGSVAANRLVNAISVGNTPLAAGAGSCLYQYDATASRWRLVSHQQGAAITTTFSAGDFTAASGTWTVGSGDIAADSYVVIGSSVLYNFNYASTTVSAAAVQLRRALPNSWTVKGGLAQVYDARDNGVQAFAVMTANNGDAFLSFNSSGASWAAAVDNTQIRGQAFFSLT